MVIYMTEKASSLSQKVTIYAHGVETLGNEFNTALASSSKASTKFSVDSRRISHLVKGGKSAGVIICFESGTTKSEWPSTHIKGPFAELGLKLTLISDIDAPGPFLTTSMRGVFAAGDSVTPYKVVNGELKIWDIKLSFEAWIWGKLWDCGVGLVL